MKYVLLVFVILSDSTTAAPSLGTAEFNDEVSCRTAAQDFEAALAGMQANVLITARCYAKETRR